MKDTWEKWRDAGILLAQNLTTLVHCPECGDADLVVEDVEFGEKGEHIERHLICPMCGARNSILLRGKGIGAERIRS